MGWGETLVMVLWVGGHLLEELEAQGAGGERFCEVVPKEETGGILQDVEAEDILCLEEELGLVMGFGFVLGVVLLPAIDSL